MTERGKRLWERDGQDWSLAMSHPLQQTALKTIEELLAALRECRTHAELDDFQRALFQQVVDAQTLQAKASRNAKRVRHGRAVPPAPSGDWAIDRWIADRVVRQLRSLGDALAWRVFGFDRRTSWRSLATPVHRAHSSMESTQMVSRGSRPGWIGSWGWWSSGGTNSATSLCSAT